MSKAPKRILSSTYTAPTATVAVGVFNLVEQMQSRQASNWPLTPYQIDYLMIAGGGGGGATRGGGGGAGGYLSGSTTFASG
jgi:hypothetical protein